MKRKSDCLENEQRHVIKKLKAEEETISVSDKEDNTNGDLKSKLENEEAECLKNDAKMKTTKIDTEQMEVDNSEDCDVDRESHIENKEKTMQGRPKPTAIHSFFCKY